MKPAASRLYFKPFPGYFATVALGIKTPVALLSEMGIEAGGDALPLELCRRLGGSFYLAQCASRT